MSGEYISREAALTVLDWDCASQDALDAIKAIPAADVVEVRHGQWNLNRKLIFVGDDFGHWRCSECGCEATFGNRRDLERYRYCPNCGAKMDGGQNE